MELVSSQPFDDFPTAYAPRGVEDKCGDNILIKIKPIVAFLGRKRFLPFYIKLSKEENHA